MDSVGKAFLLLGMAACLAAACSKEANQVPLPMLLPMLPKDALLPGCDVPGGEHIPEQCWGPALRRLTPLRAHRDMVNVAVVTAETSSQETGVYFVVPESSYLPVDKPGRRFSWNAGKQQLEFTFARP